MEEVANNSRQGSQEAQRTRSRFRKFVGSLAHVICKWVLIFMVMFVLAFGFCDIYDAVLPEKVPPIGILGRTGRETIHQHQFPNRFFRDDEKNWEHLQPALAIVCRICPEAASWCESRHDKGKLIWENANTDTVAHYDSITRVLTFNVNISSASNGEIACTIMHEFRHSRQNFTKTIKRAIIVLLQKDLDYIAENDAYLYQHEAHIAIFE